MSRRTGAPVRLLAPPARSATARAARAARMVAAARELASEGGYEAVQMREVARRAHVVPTTLYRTFPTKDDLIRAITDAEVAELHAEVLADPPQHPEVQARAAAVTVRVFRSMVADRGFAHAAMMCYKTPRPWADEAPQPTTSRALQFDDVVVLAAWGPTHRATAEQLLAVHALESVLSGGTIDWLNGELSTSQAERRIRFAARQLFGTNAARRPAARGTDGRGADGAQPERREPRPLEPR